MRTLKLTLAYDGTSFSGWQVQRNSPKPTIQETLEQAAHRVLGERVRVVGSGRTDAGVHALGQVAHIKVRTSMPLRRIRQALNGTLPPAITITHLEDAPTNFHAQHQARSKCYRYQMVTGDYVLPFERPYVHHVRVPLNIALMRREAQALLGRHAFAPFQKQGGHPVHDTRRTVTAVRLIRAGPGSGAGAGRRLTFEIEGNGFLYGMVRRIVGTLLNVGRGYSPPGTIVRILRKRKRGHSGFPSRLEKSRMSPLLIAGPSAPARGLCLLKVDYANPSNVMKKYAGRSHDCRNRP